MFGYRSSTRRSRTIKKFGRSTRPLRLEMLERRDQPAGLSVFPALHETLIEPAIDLRALAGITPAMVRNAYGFDLANVAHTPGDGAGQTIAIVTAFNNPYIQSDLRKFNETFGLPDAPSFRIAGGGSTINSSWAIETALDVQWAHAIAPGANLLLVQSVSDSLSDMMNAVDYARRQPGVSVVSMSWGASEFLGQTLYDGIFHTPFGHNPVSFIAASGDGGASAGAQWPASSPSVLAVGGTKLTVDAQGNYVGETAWSDGGAGYSRTYTEIALRGNSIVNGPRAVPDVAYAADPGSGFLVYNSAPDAKGRTGWFRVGGTSAGAPQWAGLVAIADQTRAANQLTPIGNIRAAVSSMTSDAFNDVVTGSNGFAAGKGFDMATGFGSPKAANVISQLASKPAEKPVSFVGPIEGVTLKVADKRTAASPPTQDVTQALVQAAVAADNALRAALYINSLPVRAAQTFDANNVQDVAPPPVLVTPTTSFGATWDQSIRSSNGSTSEHDAPQAPALPGGPDPGGPPAGAIRVTPNAGPMVMVQAVKHEEANVSTTSPSSDGADVREFASEASVAIENQAIVGAAVVFTFLGGCYVGVEPKRQEKRKHLKIR